VLRAVILIALGELRLVFKERSAIIWMLAMPIAFIGLFGSFMGSGSAVRPTGLTVRDDDNTFLSERMIESLRGELFSIRMAEEGDTLRPPARTLTIPAGFSDSLVSGRRVGLGFEERSNANEQHTLAARVHVQKAIARMLMTLVEIDTSLAAGGLPLEGESFRAEFRRLMERPDLIAAKARTAGKGRAVPQGFAASAPAMLVFFVMMNTVIYGAILLTQEKQTRCLARLAAQPVSRFGLLSGKLLGRILLALAQAALLLVVGRLAFGVYWGPSPAALTVLVFCLAAACGSLGLMLGSVLRTTEQASAIGWIIPLILGAIGGCWWPLEVVPGWLRTAGHISPAAWAMDGLHGLISFGRGGEAVVWPSLVLIAYTILFLGLGVRKLRSE